MVKLIFARLAISVKKIRNRRPAHGDGFFQDFTQNTIESRGLFPG